MFEDVWQDAQLGKGKGNEANDVNTYSARETEINLKAAQEANKYLRARIAELITELGGNTGTWEQKENDEEDRRGVVGHHRREVD